MACRCLFGENKDFFFVFENFFKLFSFLSESFFFIFASSGAEFFLTSKENVPLDCNDVGN